ncbi:MAG: hypothetical protein UW57_C0026G0005 [Candidatus Giovannonibacteria bacterium GW2011_GWA1_44_29]|uniref:DUF378 domain-containing protein n=1 Tax=Candidatus Giovannonibacteria bacterium GW2011_GWA1_44_29 TaxID=1618646 RepID=A0A0G1IR78_9BACT|nr:MAG: hypothetical protein UW57_C0026G0005 [Candidatus Giovannonibacteria bacterium GW2011_GWA1_44_29]
MKALHRIAFILLVVGGLNWGVWALFGWDISALLGAQQVLQILQTGRRNVIIADLYLQKPPRYGGFWAPRGFFIYLTFK